MTAVIGEWIESESREITHNNTSYAADWETLKTIPGVYEVRLKFERGYGAPKPYWILVSIPANRIAGKSYSGFGGVNYHANDLPQEETTFNIQAYEYSLSDYVKSGKIAVAPKWQWLLEPGFTMDNPMAPKNWDELKDMIDG